MNMKKGSILVVRNNHKLNLELQSQLEKDYRTHAVRNSEQASKLIDKNYFDVVIIMLNDDIDESTWFFLDELQEGQSVFTPVIFVVKQESENLQETLIRNRRWSTLPYSLDAERFMIAVVATMEMAQDVFVDKSFAMKRRGRRYLYRAQDVLRVRRSRGRSVELYLRETDKAEEFYFKYPLDEFAKRYGVEKFIKQASQSWLINIDEILFIDTVEWEIVLVDGTKIPTSKNYVGNFIEKEKE